MDIYEAIHKAEAILPGEPAAEGELDPRWQAIIAVAEHIESEPEVVWSFIQKWGSHSQEDLRGAVATCLLEHLLDYDFATYFSRVERLSEADPHFADTFLTCWKFGQSKEPSNVVRFERLRRRLMRRRKV